MTRRIILWGAGGHAKVIADVARAAGWMVVGMVDRGTERIGQVAEPGGAKVLYDEDEFLSIVEQSSTLIDAVSVAFGANAARLTAVQRLQPFVDVPTLLHPSATVSPSCEFGPGTVVMPQAVVNAGARVGAAGILNTGCVVEHDCEIEDGVHVSPNATLAGGVRVGRLSWIGAGATIIQGVRIGSSVTVGAGAVVIRDVAEGATVAGCPAAPISESG